MNTRLIGTLGITASVPAIFWLGGYNFDERGASAVICFLWTAFAFVAGITCPFWPKSK